MSTYTYDKPKRTVDLPLADMGPRLIALIIDSMILGTVGGVGWARGHGAGFGIGILIGLAYHWFFLTQNNGQTIGKLLMGIRVVKLNGEPIQTTDVLLRYFGYWLNSAIFGLGWLWALWDQDRQGWHDKLANTIVVRAR
jgi:uncharacterized RDD family membrane protein YckC